VDAEAEADVLALLAEHVVAVGLGVLALVAVGRSDEECEVGPAFDLHAGQLGLTGGPAQNDADRGLPAHYFLERLREQRAVVVQRVELRPVVQESEEHAACGAVGRLHPGRKDQAEEGEDLLVGEMPALYLGPDQVADEVVARLGPALLHDIGEIVAQCSRGGDAAIPVGSHAGELQGPTLELGVVLPRQPQNAGDDLHGEIERHRPHEVGTTLVDEGVDQLVDDTRHQIPLPTLQHFGAEARGDEGADAAVLGLVHLQDGAAHDHAHHFLVNGRGVRLAVAQHLHDLVVTEHGDGRRPVRVRDLGTLAEVDRPGVHGADTTQRLHRRVRVPDGPADHIFQLVGIEGNGRGIGGGIES
jgi:hypothetical protein